MNKEKKQIRDFPVPFNFNWEYGVSIKQIREDLDELEKLGVTRIDIQTYEKYGDSYINIEAFSNREETDLEQQERLNKLKVHSEKSCPLKRQKLKVYFQIAKQFEEIPL